MRFYLRIERRVTMRGVHLFIRWQRQSGFVLLVTYILLYGQVLCANAGQWSITGASNMRSAYSGLLPVSTERTFCIRSTLHLISADFGIQDGSSLVKPDHPPTIFLQNQRIDNLMQRGEIIGARSGAVVNSQVAANDQPVFSGYEHHQQLYDKWWVAGLVIGATVFVKYVIIDRGYTDPVPEFPGPPPR